MVRSMKNTFAPISRVPQEILSLIPDYCNPDGELVALTHVCRGWREQFISRSSLWTTLQCTNVEQTHVYLERSGASPLDIWLYEKEHPRFLNDAFLLTIPHLDRLKSLALCGSSNDAFQLTEYFSSPAPLLEDLELHFTCTETPVIWDAIFGGNLSSLRELRLSGVITSLTWTNLSNLTTFALRQVPSDKISVTQLLNFFEHAPLLRKIQLWGAFPNSSNAPPGRIVPLPHLKFLTIVAQPAHTILLDHLSIPAGASLKQKFDFSDDKSPIPTYLPKTFTNLENLSHITSVNLSLNSGVLLRLDGPSGTLYVYGNWVGGGACGPPAVGRRALRSLALLPISTMERLTITRCNAAPPNKVEKSSVYTTLLLANNLRTLALIDCFNLPIISALNPKQNRSRIAVCPELEELVLYIQNMDFFCFKKLLEMVKERASSGVKLSTITIVSSQEFVPAREVLKLRNHVSKVEYRLDDVEPELDALPTDTDGTGYDSDW